MRSIVLLVVFVLIGEVAADPSPRAETPEKDIIAVVLGKKIPVADKDRLSGLILGALLERFVRDNKIEPTNGELKAFILRSEEMDRQHQIQLEKDRKKLAAELKGPAVSEHDRKEKESRLQTIESILKSNREMKAQAGGEKQLLEMKRQMAWQFVRSWKINKALFAKYGGRVIFQQAGVEPIDAYRDFLREQQKSGAFQILDKKYEASFWRYFTNDAMHAFYPEGEGAKFINTPWWMMDQTPEQ